uniref:Uncharacterized protein n=1 Tax=Enterococcus faecium TaxID=1352 RepID=Q9X568_ENTFC|nr:unknown [Enterococcus faecium]
MNSKTLLYQLWKHYSLSSDGTIHTLPISYLVDSREKFYMQFIITTHLQTVPIQNITLSSIFSI